jgi:hypothetical protein
MYGVLQTKIYNTRDALDSFVYVTNLLQNIQNIQMIKITKKYGQMDTAVELLLLGSEN